MRNREAARYARWAAWTAVLIVVGVAGVYTERAWQRARARETAPAAVPAAVARQSARFSFSKVEQDHTVFTIRASQATQYRDRDRAILEDVWITIYGRNGNHNDNIHTQRCTYEPESGDARCMGEVEIDIQNAQPARDKSAPSSLELKTSNLLFRRDSGNASTSAPVEFSFSGGHGRGVGLDYSAKDATVRVEHAIDFDLDTSAKTGGLPVNVMGNSLEIYRNDRTVVLNGPVVVTQGQRKLTAGEVSIDLDARNQARQVIAEGHPEIHANENRARVTLSADRLEALLNPAGWVERLVASGSVAATRDSSAVADRFSARKAEFVMIPQQTAVREMTATGNVSAESDLNGESQLLKTDAVRVLFDARTQSGSSHASHGHSTASREKIKSVETLAPATIISNKNGDTVVLRAQKFVAQINSENLLSKLFGYSGVELQRRTASSAPQTISATKMMATFPIRDQRSKAEQHARLQEAEGQAITAHDGIAPGTATVRFDGSALISYSGSRTTAPRVTIDEATGVFRARGGVISTVLPSAKEDAIEIGSGAAHISADTLAGSVTTGDAVYSGHARLWQGQSVLDADRIEISRDKGKLQAAGHVLAVFPELVGSLSKSSTSTVAARRRPTLWKVRAPVLTYWSKEDRSHLAGGVTADSSEGSLRSHMLDVFLGPVKASSATNRTPSKSALRDPGLQLIRVLARGNVVVKQGKRRGNAEQAEYTAADGKFVLSGGQPTITDAAGDTATGHSLTFFAANDTILIDSQQGSPTLTKHRVEK